VINAFGDDILGGSAEVLAGVNAAVTIYLTLIWLSVFFALLDAMHLIAQRRGQSARMPIKGFVQALKLVATVIGLILILATILNKSPVYLLSGLGALTAVLLLVFRDAILGFVAGIQISVNNLVQVGDWIEMPKAGADGDVIDVSLTTVKVKNWDKTITTIPTYSLISDSFKNWRGMAETGGRRIKRAFNLDVQSIRFADEALVARWEKIDLLKGYLKQKRDEIEKANHDRGADLTILGNGRRITNVGTFRAYCMAYLRAHPQIHQDLTFLVRQLAPTEHGLPIEIYVFSKDIRWAYYEAIQADIFDHLLAVIGEFDLRIYQQPSGRDFRMALGGGSPPAAAPAKE
jgi:miniconductance mechanosensitive channel